MSTLLHQAKVFVSRNASTILTCAGGVGVVVTTIMAVKATPKALELVKEAKEEKEELTKWDICKVTAPVYVPTVLVGVSTIACIFGANVLNQHKQAALMSAYALIDSSYKEYRNKVEELYGEEADQTVAEEIAKDKYEETDISVEEDKQLFYDRFSGRYFESTMIDVLQAEYELNRAIATAGAAYLNEYYMWLDLPRTIEGKELGWSTGILEAMYWTYWVDFEHTKITMDDGLECTIVTMKQEPVIDFAYY